MEFLPHTQHVAHFYCQCSPIGNQYRGSLSQILSDPLSTIPLLHLVNANVTILVELKNCLKLKLSLDVTELLLQRAMSSANIDFVLKVTFYFRISPYNLLRGKNTAVCCIFVEGYCQLVGFSLICGTRTNTDDAFTTVSLMVFFLNLKQKKADFTNNWKCMVLIQKIILGKNLI